MALLDVMMPEIDGIELARRIKADPALAKTAVIFASSVGSRSDFSVRLLGLDIGGWLMKPVPESSLYDALVKVLASAPDSEAKTVTAPKEDRGPTPPPSAGKFKLPAGRELKVLLAEDNPINQKVARLQLGKLGIEVDVVANGREAVEAVSRQPYDLILMDCQMPEMDGYDATREIRRREGAGRKTTIVAMTAHALPGDREKCLAAGMDSYISKPVTMAALEATLAELFAVKPATETTADASAAQPTPGVEGAAAPLQSPPLPQVQAAGNVRCPRAQINVPPHSVADRLRTLHGRTSQRDSHSRAPRSPPEPGAPAFPAPLARTSSTQRLWVLCAKLAPPGDMRNTA